MLRRACCSCSSLSRGAICGTIPEQTPRTATLATLGGPSSRYVSSSSFAPFPRPKSVHWSRRHLSTAVDKQEILLEHTPPSIKLRPYQEEAIEACLDALHDGKTRIGVSSPTGSGKTTIFTHLIPKIKAKSGTRGQVLILVGNIELARQALEAVRRTLPGLRVELEQNKNIATGLADVTIATYQTLNKESRREKFDPAHFKLVIVDEAHHAAANSYLRLLNYFNHHVVLPPDDPVPKEKHEVPIIGFSATFSRPDQLALNLVFEEIVFHQEVSHMLREGWLSPARVTSLKVDLDLASVKVGRDGDFTSSSLAAHVNTSKINEMIVGVYLDQLGERRSTLVFCVDLTHVANLANAFRAAGVDARMVSSKTKPMERRQLVEDFRAGVYAVLVNCEIFTEGTDIPEIDSIVIARPTRSKNLLAQMVGRGLRLSPGTGKIDCRLIDVVDNVGRSNGIVAIPTLFGLTLEEKEALKDKKPSGSPVIQLKPVEPKRVTYIEHDDPFAIDTDTVPVLQRLSSYAWVACGKSKYVLELMFERGYITVMQETSELYSILHTPRIPEELRGGKNPNGRPTVVAQAPNLTRAIKTADAFAARRMPREMPQVSIARAAPWRKRPATAAAIGILARMKGVSAQPSEGTSGYFMIGQRRVDLDKLDNGQVSTHAASLTTGVSFHVGYSLTLLMPRTAIRHGGLGIRSKIDKVDARVEAKAQAEEDMRQVALARAVPISKRVS